MQQIDEKNIFYLGKKVKEIRETKNKSLNKFVMTKGFLTTATWSRIENGKYDIKFSTLLKVACMLDMSISELLSHIDFDYNFIEE